MINLRKILQELVDIEKKAEKIRQDAEKAAIKLVNTRKEISDGLIHEKKEALSKIREQKLKETQEALKSKIEAINKEGDQKATSISNISSKTESEALELINKRLLTV